MVELLQAGALSSLPGVVHGFTTRGGGHSSGALSSLNLALRPGELPERLALNWSAALGALSPTLRPSGLALVSQVHGAAVQRATAGAGPLGSLGDADALVTTTPGVTLAIRTADCVPVLLAVAGDRPGVAAAHAGWRGTAARIVQAALAELLALTGASPAAVSAAVGPAIGCCCYEVGPEVARAVGAAVPAGTPVVCPGPRGRPHLDLQRANAALLRQAGVRTVELVQACTACSPALYSHRADGPATGRQAGLIALVPAA